MGARGMRIARDRQSSHDPIAVDGDEDRSVGMPTNGAQVAALVRGAPPGVGRQQPLARLLPDRRRQCDEVGGVRRLGGTDRDHRTMHPKPPRRGSPAAPRTFPGLRSTADAPPKKRFAPAQTTGSKPSSSSASATPSGQPPSMWTVSPSTWSRGREIASSTASPWRTTPATTWRIAPASRTEPGAADDESRLVVRQHERRSHHARKPGSPRRGAPRRSRRARRACCSAGSRGGRRPTRSRAWTREQPLCRRRRRPRRSSSRSGATRSTSRAGPRRSRRRARPRASAPRRRSR